MYQPGEGVCAHPLPTFEKEEPVEKLKPQFVQCDMSPPERCPVEGPNGWYTRAWLPGEKEKYRREVLVKPNEDHVGKRK